jgi:hypothetical protein
LCKQIPALKQRISFASPILKVGVDIIEARVSDLKRLIDRISLLPENDKIPKEGSETTSRIQESLLRNKGDTAKTLGNLRQIYDHEYIILA